MAKKPKKSPKLKPRSTEKVEATPYEPVEKNTLEIASDGMRLLGDSVRFLQGLQARVEADVMGGGKVNGEILRDASAVASQIIRANAEIRQQRKAEAQMITTVSYESALAFVRGMSQDDRSEFLREATAYDGEDLLA